MLKSGDRANRKRVALDGVVQAAERTDVEPGAVARILTRSPMT